MMHCVDDDRRRYRSIVVPGQGAFGSLFDVKLQLQIHSHKHFEQSYEASYESHDPQLLHFETYFEQQNGESWPAVRDFHKLVAVTIERRRENHRAWQDGVL